MKETNNTIIAIMIALLIGGVIGYILGTSQMRPHMMFLPDQDVASDNGAVPPGMHRMPDGSLMHHDGMMMDHMDMMVTSERAFIEGMIPHHQEAIDTAKEVLERGGTTREIRVLAEEIIVAQEAEIADMRQWYQDWYGEAYQDVGEYRPMMRDLSRLSGRELDRTFLEDMIMHHMGAVMMAHSVQPYIENDEMAALTRAVIETQTSEIRLMERLLGEL